MKEKSLYNTLEIPGSFLVPGFSIYVLEISRGFDKLPLVTTQPPNKNKKVVEYSEQSEESIEATDRKEKDKWFYIGMTGDPHYPSARSAFHRVAGHLELSSRSTQNQLNIALKELLKDDTDLKEVNIKMHHFPIAGFIKSNEKKLDKESVKRIKQTEEYEGYKYFQHQVRSLENALIFDLKTRLLNKTKGKKLKPEVVPYPEIYKSIIELVNNG
jgi:hypothetical protein